MAQTPVIREVKADGPAVGYLATADKKSGDVVVVGSTVFVVVRDIDYSENPLGSVTFGACEVWLMPQAAETIAAGTKVYWDADGNPYGGTAGSGCVTSTATGNTLIGTTAPLQMNGTDTTAATDTYIRVLPQGETLNIATVGGSITADDVTASDASLAIGGLEAAQGGAIAITGGKSTTAGNAGGAVSITGGTAGATGAGGAVAIAGAAGGSSSGAGGAVTLAGGAGTAGNGNGGAISVLGGNAHGSGTDGVVNIGTSNSSAINIGAAGIPASIVGPLVRAAGASTAAAGDAVANAGALPAGTAGVYPTTAADDAKGVVLNAADKVTGRMIFIGNGVSNKVLKVYAPSGGTINGGSADAAFSSASGKGVIVYCLDSATNAWLAW